MYHNFIILYLYEAQRVSSDTPSIIRSLKLHWHPLVFHTWKVVGRVDCGCCQSPPTTRPSTVHVCKTRYCQCSFRLLMMGGVSLETCWASYKYGILKFWYIIAFCWIYLYELYYDARYDPRTSSSYYSCCSSRPVPWFMLFFLEQAGVNLWWGTHSGYAVLCIHSGYAVLCMLRSQVFHHPQLVSRRDHTDFIWLRMGSIGRLCGRSNGSWFS
jgi:hypothetical protein